jgi:hypothetical protein
MSNCHKCGKPATKALMVAGRLTNFCGKHFKQAKQKIEKQERARKR